MGSAISGAIFGFRQRTLDHSELYFVTCSPDSEKERGHRVSFVVHDVKFSEQCSQGDWIDIQAAGVLLDLTRAAKCSRLPVMHYSRPTSSSITATVGSS